MTDLHEYGFVLLSRVVVEAKFKRVTSLITGYTRRMTDCADRSLEITTITLFLINS